MLHAAKSRESIFYDLVVSFPFEICDDADSAGIALLQYVLQVSHLWQWDWYTLWDSLPLHTGCDRSLGAWQPHSRCYSTC